MTKTKIDALNELENEGKASIISPSVYVGNNEPQAPNIVDGLIKIAHDEMPHQSRLYPSSWAFAYRCPLAKEVANFSTIQEGDQVGVLTAIEDLIRKCVTIYDTDTDRLVSSAQINDGDRVFFLLKLREYYLPSAPISYEKKCSVCDELYTVILKAHNLRYPQLSDKLLEAFDGRHFNLTFGNVEIKFHIPTIETTSRFFRYLLKAHKDAKQASDVNTKDKEKINKVLFDKRFIMFAPYLYESGTETVKELVEKYKAIEDDKERLDAYIALVSKLKLDNYDNFETEHCESVEETEIRFPKGYKNLFVTTTDGNGYFD